MVVATVPFTHLGSPIVEHLYRNFGTAEEFCVPSFHVVAEADPRHGGRTRLTGYGTSDSGHWTIPAATWEKLIQEIELLEEVGLGRPIPSAGPRQAPAIVSHSKLFAEERKFVEQNWESLVASFRGRYVAVLGKSVLDSDKEFSALAGRVYRKFGYQRVFMPFIAERPRIYRIPSPRLVR